MSPKALYLAAFVAALVACHGPTPKLAGAYDNVYYNEEGGDLLGFRLTVREAPTPSVFFVSCEGACNGGAWFPAKIGNGRLTFTQIEQGYSSDGGPGRIMQTRYRVTKQGESLLLVSPDLPTLSAVLPPAKPNLRGSAL